MAPGPENRVRATTIYNSKCATTLNLTDVFKSLSVGRRKSNFEGHSGPFWVISVSPLLCVYWIFMYGQSRCVPTLEVCGRNLQLAIRLGDGKNIQALILSATLKLQFIYGARRRSFNVSLMHTFMFSVL